MTWLLAWKFYKSDKNGRIFCRRLFGRWEVFVGGYHESSRYLDATWRNAYAQIPEGFAPKSILMLGLAAGDNVRLLHDRYLGSHVTAVEWDPVMVKLSDDLGLYPTAWRPEVVIADAADAVRTLQGPFDLILVDIFKGGKVADAVFAEGFYDDVGKLLSPGGLALVNAFLQPASLDAAAKAMKEVSRWHFKYNWMGLFRTAQR